MKSSPASLTSVLLFGLVVSTSCASAPTINSGTSGGQQPLVAPTSKKTLILINGADTPSFANKKLNDQGGAVRSHGYQILNAGFAYNDERSAPFPVLAAALPQLNTDTWRVFPDGKMETVFRLKPNLTWHDGHPMTADDWTFSWSVYSNPVFGQSKIGGLSYVEDVAISDPRAVVLRWRQPYADAVNDTAILPPLPRHILEQSYQNLDAPAFAALPFWKAEYVGAGPFRVERDEPGAFFEATAFDGFALGRPKIDKLRMVHIADVNTVVATLLSGDGHLAIQGNLYGEDGITLEKQWRGHGGTVLYEPISARSMEFQMRPDLAVPIQLATDIRVRQAIAYSLDRLALNDAVNAGKGLVRDAYLNPTAEHADAVLSAIPERYRYDIRRAEQLLNEAGFNRGAEGSWATPSGQRFTFEHWYLPSSNNEREAAIMMDGLRGFGIDASAQVFGSERSLQDRVTRPGMFGFTLESPTSLHSREIASAATRWVGGNLGYVNPEMDRIIDAYNGTLSPSDRIQQQIQMEQIAMSDMPVLPMYWVPRVVGFVAGLQGVVKNHDARAGIERRIWEWSWAS